MPTFIVYTVQDGDTLWKIAERFDTDVATLSRMNGLRDPDRLAAGQPLRVPTMDRPPQNRPPQNRPPQMRPPREDIYVVQAGDTLGDIAFRFGTTVPVLLRMNRLDDPDMLTIGQELRVPAAPPHTGGWYEVQPGDTLFSIAQDKDMTVEELIRLNNIRTPNLIYPGERLRLS